MAKAKAGPTKAGKKQHKREVEVFRRSLRANKQVVPLGQPLEPGVTHVEGKDSKGNPLLIRKRFSAV